MNFREMPEPIAKRLQGLANARTQCGEWDLLMGKDAATKSKAGRPPADPSRKAALADNVSNLFPLGAKDLHGKIKRKYRESAVKKYETVEAMFKGDGPTVSTDIVKQTAGVLDCTEENLFTRDFWREVEPAPDEFVRQAELAVGGVMDELADAIDADPRTVAAASDALMRSELKHLHAFVTGWMHSRLMRKRASKLLEAAEPRSLESTTDS